MGTSPLMSSSHSETYISEAELFEKHPYLRNFESLIGKLEDGDILGEASQGIVIRDDQIDTVFKIPLHKE